MDGRSFFRADDTGAAPRNCVHELFERRAAADPSATAVVFGSERLDYRRLNERANKLARHLRRLGVRPDALVGVALRRSPLMVTALLGVLKAGGAYLPLDPAYPQERLAFMLADSGVQLVLTDAATRNAIDAVTEGRLRILCIESDWAPIEGECADDPEPVANGADLAYVMYTSGSTGKPKGAMITHGGLANYLSWAVEAYGVGRGDSVPLHSSLSFDLTVTSLYPPLLAGAHVELLAEGEGAQSLITALRAKRRALVKITPAHLELLSQQLSPGELAAATDALVIGGENLTADRLAMWREHAPATRLFNEYGPTETVVGCCVYEVRRDDPPYGSVPIGHPIANTQLHVLDMDLQPVPPGVTGELYIGGAGVARGYLNRPELTLQRFLPDPFSAFPGARMYKTGDFVRRRGDGVLEYIGRMDDQIKIRGYRIEPGEIEQTLALHPAVRYSAVLACEGAAGDAQLTAFLVFRAGRETEIRAAADFAKRTLPAYMVPSRFVVLDALPLTMNGKLDREALRNAARADARRTPNIEPPQTATERIVMGVFREVLERADIGVSDNFFDLGGHSLMVVRLMSRLRAVTGANLPLRDLYESPTVAALAKAIDARNQPAAATDKPNAPAIVPLRSHGGRTPVFAVAGHNGDVYCYRSLVRRLGEDQPFFGLQPPGVEGECEPMESVEELAAYFADRIRAFDSHGPYVIAGFCAGGTVAFELARELRRDGATVEFVALFGSPYPSFFRFPRRLLTKYAERLRTHARAIGALPVRAWAAYAVALAGRRKAWLAAQEERLKDPVQATRARIEQATLKAVRRYRPRFFAGNVVLFQPSRRWSRSGFITSRWRAHAAHSEECFGPDGCDTDTMLGEPHVAVLAQMFMDHCRSPSSGTASAETPGRESSSSRIRRQCDPSQNTPPQDAQAEKRS